MIVAVALSVAACSSSGDDTTAITAETSAVTRPSSSSSGGTSTAGGRHRAAGRVAAATGSTPAGTRPAPPSFEPQPIEWTEFNDAVDVGTLAVPVDYNDPNGPTFQLHLALPTRSTRRTGSARCSSTRAAPDSAAVCSPSAAAEVYDRVLRERFDIVGWDPRGTGQSTRRSTASTTTTHTSRATRRRRTTPSTQLVDTDKRFAEEPARRRHPAARRHQRQRPRHGRHQARRRRGADLVLRVQLRQRARRGVGDAVPRHRAGDGARRCRRPRRRSGPVQPPASCAASKVRSTTSWRSAVRTRAARSTTGDAAGVRRWMAQLDATPIPSAPDRPPLNRAMATVAVVQAMYRQSFWPALAQSLAPPRPVTELASCSSSTCTTSAPRTGRGATSSRRSA